MKKLSFKNLKTLSDLIFKSFFIFFMAAFLVSTSASANSKSIGGIMDSKQRAVFDAHEKRRTLSAANNWAQLDSIMVDDLTFTHPNGITDSKSQFLEAIKSKSIVYESITDEDYQVRVHGDTGIVTGTCRIILVAGDLDIDVRVVFTELWIKKDNSWLMALWHATQAP